MLRDEEHRELVIPFDDDPPVAACFECGYDLFKEHYVYVKGDDKYCSFCAPKGSVELLGNDL